MPSFDLYLNQPAVPHEEIIRLVGDERYKEFVTFCNLMQIQPPRHRDGRYIARFAPSVAIRGELQLFNLDIPRFGVRVYLDHRGTFVNLRRMDEATKRLRKEHWLNEKGPFRVYRYPGYDVLAHRFSSKPPPGEKEPRLHEFFIKKGTQGVIADCLLEPQSFQFNLNRYDFVTADLGEPYGEGQAFRAVSYVSALSGFSGGECSQCCAFMVNALLHDFGPPPPCQPHRTGIHGLAEITALTTPEKYPLYLKGLRSIVLVEYFSRIGRAVFRHSFGNLPGSPLLDHDQRARRAWAAAFVYVRSGFAPMIPGLSGQEDRIMTDQPNHMVVAVGASRNTMDDQPGDLVVNDPSELPLNVWNLTAFSSFIRPEDQAEPASRKESVEWYPIQCALPSEIRLPLTFARYTRPSHDKPDNFPIQSWEVPGVAEFADFFHRSTPFKDAARPPRLTDFQLDRIAIQNPSPGTRDVTFSDRLHNFLNDKNLMEAIERSGFLKRCPGQWVWIHLLRSPAGTLVGCNFWNASKPPPPFDTHGAFIFSYRPFLLHSFSRLERTWTSSPGIVPSTSPEKSAKSSHKPPRGNVSRKPVNLHPSLITSASAMEIRRLMNGSNWPRNVKFAELYAFMHCDCDLFPRAEIGEYSIAEYLHSIREDPEKIAALARTVGEYASAPGVTIRSIATYMPQLYSESTPQWQQARDALAAIARFAISLPAPHKIRTIEIAGGSLIRGLVPIVNPRWESAVSIRSDPRDVRNSPDLRMLAFRHQRPDAYRHLCDRLLVFHQHLIDLGIIPGFSLALEMEPGPLFILNSLPAARKIALLLDNNSKYESISKFVGFNIDIAHFALAGHSPDELFRDPHNRPVYDRIASFHISDHGLGHFADAPLGRCNFGRHSADKREILREWVRAAVDYAGKVPDNRKLAFSSIMSIELEAARSIDLIHESCSTLISLLNGK